MAQTDLSRSKGLSGRSAPLKPDEAMIFVFDEPKAQWFWMKDTWIQLEILFFGEEGKLLSAQKMSLEEDPAHPRKTYTEPQNVRVAVELSPEHPDWPEKPVLCVKPG